MQTGRWNNLIEMEENLTLDELYLLLEAGHRATHDKRRFLAAMQGVDLDAGIEDTSFRDVELRAKAELAGKSEQEYVFDLIGIEVETDDDD